MPFLNYVLTVQIQRKFTLQLEDGYTFHDYNIKLNDVIQLMARIQAEETENKEKEDLIKKSSSCKDVSESKIEIIYKGIIYFYSYLANPTDIVLSKHH